MANDRGIELYLTGNMAELKEAMQKSTASVKEGVDSMRRYMEQMHASTRENTRALASLNRPPDAQSGHLATPRNFAECL